MRNEEINQLLKSNKESLRNFIAKFKTSVINIIYFAQANKQDTIKTVNETKNNCINAFVNSLNKLKHNPNKENFETDFLRFVYEEFSQFSENSQNSLESLTSCENYEFAQNPLTENVESTKLQNAIIALTADQQMILWCIVNQNFSKSKTSYIINKTEEEVEKLFIEILKILRQQFSSPNQIEKHDLSNVTSHIYYTQSEESKKSIQNVNIYSNDPKLIRKVKVEKLQLVKFFKNIENSIEISDSEIFAGVVSKFKQTTMKISPFFWISTEVLIILGILGVILYYSFQVNPPRIMSKLDTGKVVYFSGANETKPKTSTLKNLNFINGSKSNKLGELLAGGYLSTAPFSSASCIIDDLNTVIIGADTNINILEPTSQYPIGLTLDKGFLWADFTSADRECIIKTNGIQIVPNNAKLIVDLDETTKEILIIVFEGNVSTNKNGKSKKLGKGTGVFVSSDFTFRRATKFAPDNFPLSYSISQNMYAISLNFAQRYFFNPLNELKLVFDWLNVKHYPLTFDWAPPYIIDEIFLFMENYNSVGLIYDKFMEKYQNELLVVEKIGDKLKQLADKISWMHKDINKVKLAQKELFILYAKEITLDQQIHDVDAIFPNYHGSQLNDFVHEFSSNEQNNYRDKVFSFRQIELEQDALNIVLKQLKTLINDLTGKRDKNEIVLRQIASSISSFKDNLKIIEDAKLLLKTHTEDLKTIEAKTTIVTDELLSMETKIEQSEKHIAILSKNISTLKTLLSSKSLTAEELKINSLAVDNLKTKLESLEQLIEDNSEKISNLTILVNPMKKRLYQKTKILQTAKIDFVETSKNRDRKILEEETHTKGIKKLEKKLKLIVQNISDLNAAVKSSKIKLKTATVNLKKAEDNINKIVSKINIYTSENEALEKKLIELSVRIDELDNHKDDIPDYEEQKLIIEEKITNIKNVINKNDISISRHNKILTKLKSIKDEKLHNKSSVEVELSKIEDNLVKEKLVENDLNNKIKKAISNRNIFRSELRTALTLAKNKSKEILRLENEIATISNEYQTINQEIDNLSDINTKSSQEQIILVKQMKSTCDEVKLKTDKLSSLNNQISKYKPINIIELELSKTKEDLINFNNKKTLYKTSFKKNTLIMSEVKKQIDKLVLLISKEKQLKMELEDKTNKLKNLNINKKKFNADINKYTTEYAKIKKEIENIENKLIEKQKFKNFVRYWSSQKNKIFKKENIYDKNIPKHLDLSLRIQQLENTLGNKVVELKKENLMNAYAFHTNLNKKLRKHQLNLWLTGQYLKTFETIEYKKQFNEICDFTLEKLAKYTFDYEGMKIEKEKKYEILQSALKLYPEYSRIARHVQTDDGANSVNYKWNLALTKIFHENANIEFLDLIDKKLITIPE